MGVIEFFPGRRCYWKRSRNSKATHRTRTETQVVLHKCGVGTVHSPRPKEVTSTVRSTRPTNQGQGGAWPTRLACPRSQEAPTLPFIRCTLQGSARHCVPRGRLEIGARARASVSPSQRGPGALALCCASQPPAALQPAANPRRILPGVGGASEATEHTQVGTDRGRRSAAVPSGRAGREARDWGPAAHNRLRQSWGDRGSSCLTCTRCPFRHLGPVLGSWRPALPSTHPPVRAAAPSGPLNCPRLCELS